MAINFQVMTENQKNEYGRYVPDWEALKAGASCEEEKEYIDRIIAQDERWISKGRGEFVGFAFNMVYITKQSCGHFEIFQSPHNEYHTLEKVLGEAQEHTKSKCSRCICGRY